MVCLAGIAALFWGAEPISQTPQNESAIKAMSLLAVVLGMLAGGCIAGLFAFRYRDVEIEEKGSIIATHDKAARGWHAESKILNEASIQLNCGRGLSLRQI